MVKTAQAESDGGHSFHLHLASRADGPVALNVENLEALQHRRAALFNPATGRNYRIESEKSIRIDPQKDSLSLRLAIGTEKYVENQVEEILPEEVSLTSYPNPVRQRGTFEFALPEAQEVTLRVYDVLGREVATVEQGRKEAGRHTVRLETDQLSSGVYFGRLQAGEQTLTQKITVVR